MSQNTRCDVRKCLFGGSTRWPTTFWGSNSPNTAFYKHVLASANGLKTNDVIEDWRHGLFHRLFAVIGETAYTIYSILGINAAVYFPVIKTIFGTEIQLWQVFTAFVGNLLYSVSHKMSSTLTLRQCRAAFFIFAVLMCNDAVNWRMNCGFVL